MTRSAPVRAAALVVGACLLATLASCGADEAPAEKPTFAGGGPASGDSAVDTPELRALRRDAGIDPCPKIQVRASEPANGLPDETLACLGGGRAVALDATHDKPVVVNLWASWCGPCRKELPYLQQLHERAGDRIRVLGVDYQDNDPKAALKLAAATGVTFPLLSDPKGRVRAPLDVVALPQTVFVDGRGSVVATERRQIRSYDELAGLVRTHLKVTP